MFYRIGVICGRDIEIFVPDFSVHALTRDDIVIVHHVTVAKTVGTVRDTPKLCDLKCAARAAVAAAVHCCHAAREWAWRSASSPPTEMPQMNTEKLEIDVTVCDWSKLWRRIRRL